MYWPESQSDPASIAYQQGDGTCQTLLHVYTSPLAIALCGKCYDGFLSMRVHLLQGIWDVVGILHWVFLHFSGRCECGADGNVSMA